MANEDNLHQGDKVSWHTHGTTTEGTVQKKITSDTQGRRPEGQGGQG